MRIDYRELKHRIRLVSLLERIGWTSTEGRDIQSRQHHQALTTCTKIRRALDTRNAVQDLSGERLVDCLKLLEHRPYSLGLAKTNFRLAFKRHRSLANSSESLR